MQTIVAKPGVVCQWRRRIMRKATPENKGGVNRWARRIGKLTAEGEMRIIEAKTGFEVKVRRLRAQQHKILKKLAAQHLANQRALTEFRAGIRKASEALSSAYRRAIRQFQSRSSQKSKRVRARRK